MLAYILHANYDTQSSYKNTVELLHKEQQDYALDFVFTPCFRPRIVVFRPERFEASAVAYVLSSSSVPGWLEAV